MSDKKVTCIANLMLISGVLLLIAFVYGIASYGVANDLIGNGGESGSTGEDSEGGDSGEGGSGEGDSGGGGSEGEDPEDPDSCPLVELNTPISLDGGDFISLVYTACPSEVTFEAFNNAATRLSSIVTNPHTGVQLDEDLPYDEFCTFIEADGFFPAGSVFDNLVVIVEPGLSEDMSGYISNSGVCGVVNDFPILGGIRFDSDYFDSIDSNELVESLFLHEMLHTAGFGKLWGSLLVDPVFTVVNDTIVGDPNADPVFVGTNAREEYGVLLGNTGAQDVPVEDDGDGQYDVSALEGLGAVDSHWRIDTFGFELMTSSFSLEVPEQPLSKMTIASLRDLGYTVNENNADSYSLPFDPKPGSNLRGSSKGFIDLSGDTFIPEPEDLQRFESMVRKI